ncbi:MAG: hypothetical protein RMK67_00305 [Chloroflexota bacterium]|nr:hypothetical protein [Chloroflexota bacterium]
MKAGVRKGKGPAALALWALGALGALAALVFLAGPQGAEAHPPPTGAGVEIIDTATSAFAGHHLWPAASGGDAAPSHFLNLDTNGDTVHDAISVPAGTTVRLAVHVRDLSGDPNSTAAAPVNVSLTATGSAFFTRWSRVGQNGNLDTNGDGTDNGTGDGGLFDGLDSQSVTAQAVSDNASTQTQADIIDGGVDVNQSGGVANTDDLNGVRLLTTAGAVAQVDIIDGGVDVNQSGVVDAADDLTGVVLVTTSGIVVVDIINGRVDVNRDTVIDVNDDLDDVQLITAPSAPTTITGTGFDNPDGIAIFEVLSLTPTDATITAAVSGLGSDTVRIIWFGQPASVTVTSREARLAQDINSAGPTQTNTTMTFVGDPDSLLSVRVTDSAGNPIVTQVNVFCFLATGGRGLANIAAAGGAPPNFTDDGEANDTLLDTDRTGDGGDLAFAPTNNGVAVFVLESQDNGGRGDVAVTCWADTDGGNDFDAGEPSGTVTVKVVGAPASVALTGNATMNVGDSQTLTAAVSDSDGNPVADGVLCLWSSFGNAGGLLTPGVVPTSGGNSTNTVVAASQGSLLVRVVCDNDNGLNENPPVFPDANDPSRSLNITVQAAGAPGVPPAPPTQVALWPATTSQAQITFQAPAGATSYRLCTASNFNFTGETCSDVTASGNIILVPLPTADQQAVYIRLAACNSAGCSSLVFVGSLARRVPFGPNDWNFVAGTFNYLGTTFAWGQNLVSTPGKNSNFEFYRGVQGFGGTLVATCSSVAPGSSCVQSWATGGDTYISVAQVFPPFPPVGVALQVQ